MTFQLEYFHPRVLAEIESWPVDILADYAHLAELLIEFGPTLRLPHSRAMGKGLFELRAEGRSGSARAFYCFMLGKRIIVVHAFNKKSRQTPARELRIARRRVEELQDG